MPSYRLPVRASTADARLGEDSEKEHNMHTSVFLHGLWRSCSTYFWTKFRANPGWRCFYEPLHETLLHPDIARASRSNPSHPSALRHPPMSEHYFAEYDAADGDGVPGFQKRFTAENFYLSPDDEDQPLEAYFRRLMAHATANAQRPFFQPTRAFLRAEWLKQRLGGIHIYLNRDVDQLLRSYFSYGLASSYFLQCHALIIGQNARHPLYAEIAAYMNLNPFHAQTFEEERLHFARAIADWDLQQFIDMVALQHTLALIAASRYADCLIETNKLWDSNYRMTVECCVSDLAGIALDLTDFSLPGPSGPEFLPTEEAVEIMRRAATLIKPDWLRLDQLGASTSMKQLT